ncbi:MAG: YidB family protein [Polaromonas sp.]|nr:YidB family protein [Polaromonas sp.]
MGILDSVLGTVLNNGQPVASGTEGGLAGLVSMAARHPQLVQIVTGLLANHSDVGGLGGLISKFEQAGLGDAMQSWIGGGPNQPVSGAQVSSALGSGTVADIAARLGVAPDMAAGQLAQVLPGLINQLTPNGQAPEQGLGSSSDLMGLLGGLLQPR